MESCHGAASARADLRSLQDIPWDGETLLAQTARVDGTTELVGYISRSGRRPPE